MNNAWARDLIVQQILKLSQGSLAFRTSFGPWLHDLFLVGGGLR